MSEIKGRYTECIFLGLSRYDAGGDGAEGDTEVDRAVLFTEETFLFSSLGCGEVVIDGQLFTSIWAFYFYS